MHCLTVDNQRPSASKGRFVDSCDSSLLRPIGKPGRQIENLTPQAVWGIHPHKRYTIAPPFRKRKHGAFAIVAAVPVLLSYSSYDNKDAWSSDQSKRLVWIC